MNSFVGKLAGKFTWNFHRLSFKQRLRLDIFDLWIPKCFNAMHGQTSKFWRSKAAQYITVLVVKNIGQPIYAPYCKFPYIEGISFLDLILIFSKLILSNTRGVSALTSGQVTLGAWNPNPTWHCLSWHILERTQIYFNDWSTYFIFFLIEPTFIVSFWRSFEGALKYRNHVLTKSLQGYLWNTVNNRACLKIWVSKQYPCVV